MLTPACAAGEKEGGSGAVIAELNPLNPSCTNSREKSMETTEDGGQQPHRELQRVEGGGSGWGVQDKWRYEEEEESDGGGRGELSQVLLPLTLRTMDLF